MEEKAFLLGVTIEMPFFRNKGYESATSWFEVLSTSTTLPGAFTRYSANCGRGRGGVLEAASSDSQLLRDL